MQNQWGFTLLPAGQKIQPALRLPSILHPVYPPASVGAASYMMVDQSVAEDNWVWGGLVDPPRSTAHHPLLTVFLAGLRTSNPIAQSPRARRAKVKDTPFTRGKVSVNKLTLRDFLIPSIMEINLTGPIEICFFR